MSLRWKIALAMAVIASLASILVGVASYQSTSDRLYAEVDRSLLNLDSVAANRRPADRLPDRGPLAGYDIQVVLEDGSVGRSTLLTPLPVDDVALATVGRARTNTFSTVADSDGSYRVRTVGVPQGAIQVIRSLDETDRVLESLRRRTLLLTLVVAAVSAAAGLWIASRVTASLRRLTAAAEVVEQTGRLDVEVSEIGTDEVGRLGAAFDRMLQALAASRDDQRRLVQDAGHELRTPLTSLRTNIETLQRYSDLRPDEREAIVSDLHDETEELTNLVNEIVAVASGEGLFEPASSFDLVDVVVELSARYERRSDRKIVVSAEPSVVVAQRGGVQRAVSSLLDNACKFDESGGQIEISVVDGTVTVADHGPGIPEGALDHVFERFSRADAARSTPGSGLGLSIVRDVARRHGGEAFARNRDGGGAEVGFTLVGPPTDLDA